ncbi:hypothetical protein [Helicobacter suis]|uniref:hypothetical protein n=1 Tax=Helicobacter suis TaxID=104628 RepID=UPI0013D49D1C|nr:hypothetical protein [Helicobacter suis]
MQKLIEVFGGLDYGIRNKILSQKRGINLLYYRRKGLAGVGWLKFVALKKVRAGLVRFIKSD